MPVTSAVINLSDDAVARRVALDHLESDPRIDLGPRQDLYQPIVLATDTIDAGQELVEEELPDVEGVEFVRIVRVDFDDTEERTEREQRGSA